MELEFTADGVVFNRDLSPLDEFTLSFVELLTEKYVVISGYVSILFGRSRSSEDIDIFIEPLSEDAFLRMWNRLMARFECLSTDNPHTAYKKYLADGLSVRFSYPGSYIPNMEVKLALTEGRQEALGDRMRVILNGRELFVSSIERQLAYKLYLGSDKDIEDGMHLYHLFKEKIDRSKTASILRKLDIPVHRLQEYE